MASTLLFPLHVSPISSPKFPQFPLFSLPPKTLISKPSPATIRSAKMVVRAESLQSLVSGTLNIVRSNPATWHSALLSNLLIFVVGSPILVSGLSVSGIASAFLLGTLTWRAFGPSGFLLVATYFILVRPHPPSLSEFRFQFRLIFMFDWWGFVFARFSWIELVCSINFNGVVFFFIPSDSWHWNSTSLFFLLISTFVVEF